MKKAGDAIPGLFSITCFDLADLSGGLAIGAVPARGAVAAVTIAFTQLQELWRALAVPVLLAAAFAFASPITATVT